MIERINDIEYIRLRNSSLWEIIESEERVLLEEMGEMDVAESRAICRDTTTGKMYEFVGHGEPGAEI